MFYRLHEIIFSVCWNCQHLYVYFYCYFLVTTFSLRFGLFFDLKKKTLVYIIPNHYLGNLVMLKSIFSRGLGNSISIHLANARLSCGVEYRIGHGAPAPTTPLPHADSAYSYRVHIKTIFCTKKNPFTCYWFYTFFYLRINLKTLMLSLRKWWDHSPKMFYIFPIC